MPWHLLAKKDVEGCEKLREAAKQAMIRRCPNGETHRLFMGPVLTGQFIACQGERGELKHLSIRRQKTPDGIPSVAASERGPCLNRLNVIGDSRCWGGVVRCVTGVCRLRRK